MTNEDWSDRQSDGEAEIPEAWMQVAFPHKADRPAPGGREFEVPERFGPYLIRQEIGRGGQATVFLAEDTRLGRRVALKVIRDQEIFSAAALQRFAREAVIASKLDHPGICRVYETGTEAGLRYIAMQYLDGETLARKIASVRAAAPASSSSVSFTTEIESPAAVEAAPSTSSKMTDREDVLAAVAFTEKAARALHAAHEAGVLHRDIKPGNLMVTSSGDPVLMDFGLAWEEDSDLPSLTRSGDLFGTPAYMSPEQLTRQTIRLDRRTDVWSLGVTLYEGLTLRRPFEAPTREALFQAKRLRSSTGPLSGRPTMSPSGAGGAACSGPRDGSGTRSKTSVANRNSDARIRSRPPPRSRRWPSASAWWISATVLPPRPILRPFRLPPRKRWR